MKKKTLALVTAFAMTGMLPSAYAEDSTQKLVEHVHKSWLNTYTKWR
ncbi:hypothetical protein [Vibrio campbellii]